jgi:hypothetical protein
MRHFEETPEHEHRGTVLIIVVKFCNKRCKDSQEDEPLHGTIDIICPARLMESFYVAAFEVYNAPVDLI